jgi:hypothetical protein
MEGVAKRIHEATDRERIRVHEVLTARRLRERRCQGSSWLVDHEDDLLCGLVAVERAWHARPGGATREQNELVDAMLAATSADGLLPPPAQCAG